MTLEEMKEFVQQQLLEHKIRDEDDMARREHLKRQYLRLHHMERKLQDYKKLKEVTKMKRQVMKMMVGKEH